MHRLRCSGIFLYRDTHSLNMFELSQNSSQGWRKVPIGVHIISCIFSSQNVGTFWIKSVTFLHNNYHPNLYKIQATACSYESKVYYIHFLRIGWEWNSGSYSSSQRDVTAYLTIRIKSEILRILRQDTWGTDSVFIVDLNSGFDSKARPTDIVV